MSVRQVTISMTDQYVIVVEYKMGHLKLGGYGYDQLSTGLLSEFTV